MAEPYWADDQITLYLGKCEQVLPGLAAESVDAIVTDPPAAVSFMGREWDSDRGGRARWVEWLAGCMEAATRCLKPGGHALVWSLPRTAHWTAWALEDAGLEIRDCIPHLFGSGFPKSLDVSKAIDRRRDDAAAIHRVTAFIATARSDSGLTNRDIDNAFGFNGMAGHWTNTRGPQAAVPTWEQWEQLRGLLGFGDSMDAEVWRLNGRKGSPGEAWSQREVIGERTTGIGTGRGAVAVIADGENRDITAPATEDAARWEGWGTALKPGQELWWLARKPFKGSVAGNVLDHGTGALNVAGCRVGADVRTNNAGGASSLQRVSRVEQGYRPTVTASVGAVSEVAGRWPPNLLLTHSAACGAACADDCPVAELDRQSGYTEGGNRPSRRGGIGYGSGAGGTNDGVAITYDAGGASRFYPAFRYQAKAPAYERPRLADGTAHSTVKPVSLMQWLVRLITPPGGVVLDCYAGTGTTAEACIIEGFRCVLIEQDPVSAELIRTRLRKDIQPALFGGAA